MIRVDGVDYSPEAVERVRTELIELRNVKLIEPDFTQAVLLSHVVAYLSEYRELLLLNKPASDGIGYAPVEEEPQGPPPEVR